MDITKIANELAAELTKDASLLERFKKNAKATVKKLVNIDLPDDAVDAVVKVVKAKVLGNKVFDNAAALGDLINNK